MNSRTWIFALALGAVALGASAWRIQAAGDAVLARHYPQPGQPLAITPRPAMAAEGARLVRLNGCAECHGANLAGGVMLTGWLGTKLIGPNLTTLTQHDSVNEIAAAIRYGVKPDGHSVLAMPAHRFLTESDSDVAAMIAYLQTRKPLADAYPKTQWHFDGKVMLALGLIPAAAPFAHPADRGPLTTPQAPMALARYITRTQCAACHGKDLSGETEEHTPDLRFSIVHYSPEAFHHFFQTGDARQGHGTGTMTPLIRQRLHNLTPREVQAIYAYLHVPAGAAMPGGTAP